MITSVAVPYQTYQLTHSTLMVGLLSFLQLMPLLVTALIGGVLADRYHRRLLLIVSETSLAVGCLVLALNSAYLQQLWAIFSIAIVMAAITGLHRPALDSITQQLLKKEDFAEASTLSTFKFSVGMIAGPAIGGLIIANCGLFTTYLIDVGSFVISLMTLLLMTHIPTPIFTQDESTWASLKSGFNYAARRQELVGTYVVDFVAMIFGMPYALFPALATYFGGASSLGLLYSAPAVGSLIISFVSGWIQKVKRQGLAVSLSATFWGVSILFFGIFWHHFWLGLFFLALAGGADTVSGIFRGIIWNTLIPNNYRGRLAGIEMISYLSGPKLGDAEAGIVAAAFGITTSIISGGVLCLAGVFVCSFFLPRFIQYCYKPEPSPDATLLPHT